MDTGPAEPLFASPNVVSKNADDGSVILRSADPLGAYPSTVMHSVRAWADLDPDHLLVAERGPDGPGGAAVTARRWPPPTGSARPCSIAGWARTGRCWCCPATASTTCS